MSCGIGASRPRQLFRLIATWKGPLLPHGLIGPGGDGLPSTLTTLHHRQQTGGRDAVGGQRADNRRRGAGAFEVGAIRADHVRSGGLHRRARLRGACQARTPRRQVRNPGIRHPGGGRVVQRGRPCHPDRAHCADPAHVVDDPPSGRGRGRQVAMPARTARTARQGVRACRRVDHVDHVDRLMCRKVRRCQPADDAPPHPQLSGQGGGPSARGRAGDVGRAVAMDARPRPGPRAGRIPAGGDEGPADARIGHDQSTTSPRPAHDQPRPPGRDADLPAQAVDLPVAVQIRDGRVRKGRSRVARGLRGTAPHAGAARCRHPAGPAPRQVPARCPSPARWRWPSPGGRASSTPWSCRPPAPGA